MKIQLMRVSVVTNGLWNQLDGYLTIFTNSALIYFALIYICFTPLTLFHRYGLNTRISSIEMIEIRQFYRYTSLLVISVIKIYIILQLCGYELHEEN